MANQLTAKDLEVIAGILKAEGMACKKARVYSKTLTDTALAACMQDVADCHQERFNKLLKMLEGK